MSEETVQIVIPTRLVRALWLAVLARTIALDLRKQGVGAALADTEKADLRGLEELSRLIDAVKPKESSRE